MKLGLLARCDARGVAWQCAEFFNHMHPDKVLCVLMNDAAWPEDPGRFGSKNVTFVDSNLSSNLNARILDERKCRKFLEGLDVVFAVETVYDWAFVDWAHEAGAEVIVQSNPEFSAHHNNPTWTPPDLWAWPTPWMVDELDALGYGNTILPVPCVEREQTAADPQDETLRVLHVVGKTAASDRNGTLEFIEAVPSLRQKIHVTVVTQEDTMPRRMKPAPNVTVEAVTGGVEDRWSLFENQHMLVMPRKYGGLSLPTIEAMACGLTVMMTDTSPNEIWPGPRITARKGRIQPSPFGKIQCFSVHPLDVASKIDRLARDRDQLAEHMDDAARFAEQNSWANLRPRLYDPLLEGML